MVALNFNAAGVKPNTALEAIPSGLYAVMITNSQEKPTKAGTGSYLELEMTVQGGEYQGRKLFDRLNLNNQNQQAVDIAYATLSAICHVTGVMQIQDSSQLHGRPFQVVANKVERNDRPGEFSNEVKGYKDMQGNDPGHAGAVSSGGAQPQWANNQGGGNQQQVQQQPQNNGGFQQGNQNTQQGNGQQAQTQQTNGNQGQDQSASNQGGGGFGNGGQPQNNGGGNDATPPWARQ